MGEIGSSGHVQGFPDRWIREKHGRQDASSMWEVDGVCKWRERGLVQFQMDPHTWAQVFWTDSEGLGFCY